MSAEIVELNVITTLDIPPQRVLQRALDAKLGECVIIGLGPDGNFWFAASKANGADALWLLEIAKKRLLDLMDTGSKEAL